MLMMRAPLAIAQSMPATMLCVVACCGVLRIRAERVDRQNAGARRDAEQLAVGHDRARHPGAVLVRLVRRRDGVELAGDRAGEIGMGGIDLGIDHGDQHVGPGSDTMGFGKPQLGDHILGGGIGPSARLGAAAAARRRGGILLQAVNVIRLGDADILGFERAHRIGDLRPSSMRK